MDICTTKKLLHKYLIDNKIFGNYRYVGNGSNGFAFHINNQIVKITLDEKEVVSSTYLMDNPHKSIVEYYQIDWIDNIGYVRMEYVIPLDPYKDHSLVKHWHEIIYPDIDKVFDNYLEQHRIDILDIRSSFKLDITELHWGNAGFNDVNKLKFFDLKLNHLID